MTELKINCSDNSDNGTCSVFSLSSYIASYIEMELDASPHQDISGEMIGEAIQAYSGGAR